MGNFERIQFIDQIFLMLSLNIDPFCRGGDLFIQVAIFDKWLEIKYAHVKLDPVIS